MNKVQSSLPATDGEFTQTGAVQDNASPPPRVMHGDVRTDEDAGPAEHSLLFRPVAPQGRRSLFRR